MRNIIIFIGAFQLLLVAHLPIYAISVDQVQLSSTITTQQNSLREKNIIQLLSSTVFSQFTRTPLNISIDHSLIEPRGRMRGPNITLSAQVVRESEFLKLFVHEFAHFLDIYVLVYTGTTKDVSSQFYMISWKDAATKRAGQTQQNFVSGYAATNQYEDFAESLVLYVFHNRTFEDRALRDDILRQKYLFFQRYIFDDGEFIDTDFSIGKMPKYTWDTTKFPISLQKYLYSLN